MITSQHINALSGLYAGWRNTPEHPLPSSSVEAVTLVIGSAIEAQKTLSVVSLMGRDAPRVEHGVRGLILTFTGKEGFRRHEEMLRREFPDARIIGK